MAPDRVAAPHRASVVVPTYNSADLLAGCLESLAWQRDAGEVEVVVVDDGSTDGTAALVASYRRSLGALRYVHRSRSERSARGAARNAGAAAATGDVLVFLDGDQIASADFVARHLRHHATPGAAVIGFRKYLVDRRSDVPGFCRTGEEARLAPVRNADLRLTLLDLLAPLPGPPATAWHLFFSCNVSVSAADFHAVGGFCEEFTGWGLEDSELGYRLARRGCRFVLDRESVVYHQGPPPAPSPDGYAAWQANLERFMRRHDHPVEVALQKLLAPFFDPRQDGDWLDCYQRFELAARAAAGR